MNPYNPPTPAPNPSYPVQPPTQPQMPPQQPPQGAPGVNVSPLHAYKLAGLGERVGAFLIDLFILAVLWVTIFQKVARIIFLMFFVPDEQVGFVTNLLENTPVMTLKSLADDPVWLRIYFKLIIAQIITYTLLEIAYFAGFWVFTKGQTPGKKLLKIRIISENGGIITPKQAFLRVIGYIISALPAGLLFLIPFFDKNRQGLHDKMAGTIVIDERQNPQPKPPTQPQPPQPQQPTPPSQVTPPPSYPSFNPPSQPSPSY